MIVFPNAKINLGLRILNKRSDGYHNIQSYMIPVNLCDALEIVPSPDEFSFSSSGLPFSGPDEDNLCVKAFRLVEKNYHISPVRIHLHKIIPIGSGLGGGSSDAAFALTLLRRLFDLKLCNNELEMMASMLGSDCPFFIVNKPRLIEDTGKPTQKFLHLPTYHIVIVIPDVQVSTAWAYGIVKPNNEPLPAMEALINHEDNWPELLINDFEGPVFKHYPVLAEIKETLYRSGAFYASMSGSGSAVFGLFRELPDVTGLFPACFVWQGTTGE